MYIFRKLILSTLTNNVKFPFFYSFALAFHFGSLPFPPPTAPLHSNANMRARFHGKTLCKVVSPSRIGKHSFCLVVFLCSHLLLLVVRYISSHAAAWCVRRDFSGLPIINNVKQSEFLFFFSLFFY